MADTLTPEQRARDVLSAIWNGSDAVPAIAHTIRAAETAAVDRCVETLLNMGMHGTAEMLRAALEEPGNV